MEEEWEGGKRREDEEEDEEVTVLAHVYHMGDLLLLRLLRCSSSFLYTSATELVQVTDLEEEGE
eukprot:74357-Pyramimonas_sp.AAC.1